MSQHWRYVPSACRSLAVPFATMAMAVLATGCLSAGQREAQNEYVGLGAGSEAWIARVRTTTLTVGQLVTTTREASILHCRHDAAAGPVCRPAQILGPQQPPAPEGEVRPVQPPSNPATPPAVRAPATPRPAQGTPATTPAPSAPPPLDLTREADRQRLVDEFDRWRQKDVEIRFADGRTARGVLLQFDGTRLTWKPADGRMAHARLEELAALRALVD